MRSASQPPLRSLTSAHRAMHGSGHVRKSSRLANVSGAHGCAEPLVERPKKVLHPHRRARSVPATGRHPDPAASRDRAIVINNSGSDGGGAVPSRRDVTGAPDDPRTPAARADAGRYRRRDDAAGEDLGAVAYGSSPGDRHPAADPAAGANRDRTAVVLDRLIAGRPVEIGVHDDDKRTDARAVADAAPAGIAAMAAPPPIDTSLPMSRTAPGPATRCEGTGRDARRKRSPTRTCPPSGIDGWSAVETRCLADRLAHPEPVPCARRMPVPSASSSRAQDPRRNAAGHRARGNVAGHDAAGRDHRAGADPRTRAAPSHARPATRRLRSRRRAARSTDRPVGSPMPGVSVSATMQ